MFLNIQMIHINHRFKRFSSQFFITTKFKNEIIFYKNKKIATYTVNHIETKRNGNRCTDQNGLQHLGAFDFFVPHVDTTFSFQLLRTETAKQTVARTILFELYIIRIKKNPINDEFE